MYREKSVLFSGVGCLWRRVASVAFRGAGALPARPLEFGARGSQILSAPSCKRWQPCTVKK